MAAMEAAMRPQPAAAGAAVAEEAMPVPTPVPMEELDWSKYVESADVVDPDFCLWCTFAVCAKKQAGNKHWMRLKKYAEENWGRVHPFKFAREMQRIYDSHIRSHLSNDLGERVWGPVWPAQQIHDHCIRHVFNARCAHIENCFTYQTALRRLRDKALFMSDGTVDLAILKRFAEIEKQARVLYDKVDVSKGDTLI
jgi:hypothetical protein